MIGQRLKDNGLTIVGGFHPTDDEWLYEHATALLIGPDEPSFWPHFITQPEYLDGLPDAMDRFSKRVLNQLAHEFDGTAYYPSDGPPYPPFVRWAFQSGCHSSPVNLLVHGRSGLLVSFRGMLALKEKIAIATPPQNPCPTCEGQPCRTACPINALTPEGYDVDACKDYLKTEAGKPCISGCKVRLSCPSSQKFGRLEEHSQFHMTLFANS